jgi:hypothetical protein
MSMTVLEADRTIAEQQVNPPELLASTLIKPDKPIANPRKTRQAVYEVRFKNGQPGAQAAGRGDGDAQPRYDLPRAGFQRVVWANEETARVVLDLNDPVAPERDTVKDEHRAASISLNSDDPEVRKLMAQAFADQDAVRRVAKHFKQEPDKLSNAAKAEVLRRFVSGFIQEKNLSVGFATASEVARTAEGDCTEHGVLLAALLRAAGVPSRTATGLIYVDEFVGQSGVFGYHMWTQAWLEDAGPLGAGVKGGRWVDLDATLGDDTPYDAAHILLGVSAMNDADSMNDMVAMSSIIGRLEVKVVEVK